MNMGKMRIRPGDMVRLKNSRLYEVSAGKSCWESQHHEVPSGTLAIVTRVGPCECGSSECAKPIRFTVILEGKMLYVQRYNMSPMWRAGGA